MPSRLLRELASWIAVLAVVAVTFMPTLTRLASAGGDGIDVCTADAPRAPAPADGGHALDHCPYCALHAELVLPPAPPTDARRAASRFRAHPPAFLAAPRATAIWSTAQSRAPPAFA
jgi:hypothetical protein